MPYFAITAIGEDRPGIVAGLTEALRDAGGNLEDVSSTILRGHFSMMMVASTDDGVEAPELEGRLAQATAPLGVSVTVRDVSRTAPERPQATHVLTAYGSDHPGIVAGFARLLADRGVNVTDLSCRLVGDEKPVYAMITEMALPEDADLGALESALRAKGAQLGVDVTLRSVDVETL